MATREIYWNIDYGFIIYFFIIPVVIALAYGIYQRYRLWRVGQPDNRLDNLPQRSWTFAVTGVMDGLVHRRFLREPYPGLIHFLIFWGAIAFLLATAIDSFTHYLVGKEIDGTHLHGLWGDAYLYFSLSVDLLGILALIGIIIAAYRRYIQKPDRLDNKPENAIAIALFFVIVLTGFIVEGLRIAYFTANPAEFAKLYPALGNYDPSWALWSPGGWVLAKIFGGVSAGGLLLAHRSLWWFHTILALGAIVYVAVTWTMLAHIVVAPVNVLFRSSRPKGALAPVNLEEAETFGVDKISGFTWKQLFDLDACTRCGRCQDMCPAYLSGKALSPKKMIQDLKQHWLDVGPGLVKAKAGGYGGNPGEKSVSMIGDVITAEIIWDCTTCRACQEVCPVFIEHIDKIIDMRRNLVLEQAEMPEPAEIALRCMEERGHTCKGTTACRIDWFSDIGGAKLLSEDQDVEILYFVGCSAALEDRNMKVSASFGRILQAAGVKFGVLGEEESCCGEPARRMGNEYLFQMQAMKNIETFKRYGVKKIVVSCPHGYNTLKNEYPQFGGEFEVVHHSQFIAELIKQGRLKLKNGIVQKITYHDACYLGRHNDVYNEPRQVVAALPGAQFTEMERHRGRSFCCGAGGGHMWMEETVGTRISEMRTDQALATQASVIATACPFCLQMFEDAIKAKEASDSLKAMDIAELVAGAIGGDLPVSERVNTEQSQYEEVAGKETPQEEQPKE
ncbi:MAG: (Fe-S)-binding protein [Dehalococcoidia bacterium]|nr:(Fe-S)-binding protein [Dehalococcoidia bacterium]